jgi:hypothetical protein
MEAIRQMRDQIPEHMAGAGETVQQQKLGRILAASLPVKDLHPVYVNRPILGIRHDPLLSE